MLRDESPQPQCSSGRMRRESAPPYHTLPATGVQIRSDLTYEGSGLGHCRHETCLGPRLGLIPAAFALPSTVMKAVVVVDGVCNWEGRKSANSLRARTRRGLSFYNLDV